MSIIFADHEPKTLQEAVDIIYKNLTDDERKEIKQVQDGVLFHFGFGMQLRNNWGLWTGSPLKDFFINTYGLGHADDMSGIILDCVVNKVHGNPSDVNTMVQRYKDYWAKEGIDPVTMQKLP